MRYFFVLMASAIFFVANAQRNSFADGIRTRYKIPELAFAVVSSDSVLEQQVSGVQRVNTIYTAQPGDRFHIGSNTKAITSFIAALLVEQKQIRWDTKFFDLFPRIKKQPPTNNHSSPRSIETAQAF